MALGAGLLALAACAPAEDPPSEDPTEDTVEPAEPPEEPPEPAEEALEPDEGSTATEEAAGPTLTVEPTCAEIGDGFTVTATGLEAGQDHAIQIVPPHSEDIDSGVMGTAAADGTLEAPASLPEEADIEVGNYTLTLGVFEQEEILATTDLEIAEAC